MNAKTILTVFVGAAFFAAATAPVGAIPLKLSPPAQIELAGASGNKCSGQALTSCDDANETCNNGCDQYAGKPKYQSCVDSCTSALNQCTKNCVSNCTN